MAVVSRGDALGEGCWRRITEVYTVRFARRVGFTELVSMRFQQDPARQPPA